MTEAHLYYTGTQRKVYALVQKQKYIFEDDYPKNMPKQTKDKVDEYIKFLADAILPITNRHISRKLHGYENLFELKPKNVRIFYFFFGQYAVLISSCTKQPKKSNENDFKRAENLKKQFLSEN